MKIEKRTASGIVGVEFRRDILGRGFGRPRLEGFRIFYSRSRMDRREVKEGTERNGTVLGGVRGW